MARRRVLEHFDLRLAHRVRPVRVLYQTVVKRRHELGRYVVVDPPQQIADRVRLSFTGANTYNFEGSAPGTLRVRTDTFGVLSVTGSGDYVGQGGSAAKVTVTLNRFLVFNAFSGSVRVQDPGATHPNVLSNVVLRPLSRPSATSVRGSVSASQSGIGNFVLGFTIDDRV